MWPETSTNNSCGYTCLLPKVTLWVIALGWDRFGFPVRFSPPVTLQIITQDQLLTWQYLAGNFIHHGDRKPRNIRLACGRSFASNTVIPGRFSYPKTACYEECVEGVCDYDFCNLFSSCICFIEPVACKLLAGQDVPGYSLVLRTDSRSF